METRRRWHMKQNKMMRVAKRGCLLLVCAFTLAAHAEDIKRSGDAVEVVSPMILNGEQGLELKSEPLLQLKKGFSIECRICPSDVSTTRNIVTKDGEYLLRINDPKPDDGRIAFFVNLDGRWEPRVTSVKPEVNHWYHIIATWDGETATLWVNGFPFVRERSGQTKATENPVIIGKPSKWASRGFVGTIEKLIIYNRLLTAGEILARFFPPSPGSKPLKNADFNFDRDAEGWQASEGVKAECEKGVLSLTVSDRATSVRSPVLDVDTAEQRFISLRMAVDKGTEGRLTFVTDKGIRTFSFALKSDGVMHTYIFPAWEYPEWRGKLLQLVIQPSDEPGAKVSVDFLKVAPVPAGDAEVEVKLLPDRGLPRALRDEDVIAVVSNTGAEAKDLTARLVVPAKVKIVSEPSQRIASLSYGEQKELRWTVRAAEPMEVPIEVVVSGGGVAKEVRAGCTMRFSSARKVIKDSYVPEPKPVKSKYLIGINYFPGWKQGTHYGWEKIEPFPERKPVLGWYDEGSPEVADWEIKWCLEHGVSFFNYCWYNGGNIGIDKKVVPRLEHALEDGLLKSRYVSMFKFTIMFENGGTVISTPSDLTDVLFDYWLKNYFSHPSYLKVDNKPVLFIYLPHKLRKELGGSEAVRNAFELMRRKCIEKGFAGLIIIGMYHTLPPDPAEMKQVADDGYDGTSAYAHIFRHYKGYAKCPKGEHIHSPDEAIKMHEEVWQARRSASTLPYILNLTMGWDVRPWRPHTTIAQCRWVIPPKEFKVLCQKAKTFLDTTPGDRLDSKILLIDNWNEWGEGHYVAPCRQYGFGYLDAIREVFTDAPSKHEDLTPEDVGLGPYDNLYKRWETHAKQ